MFALCVMEGHDVESKTEQCSMGIFLKDGECHKLWYSRSSVMSTGALGEDDVKLVRRRVGAGYEYLCTSICTFHRKQYLDSDIFKFRFGQKCCDPFKKHDGKRSAKKKNLRMISIELADCNTDLKLVPGKSLWTSGYKTLAKPNSRFVSPEIAASDPEDVNFTVSVDSTVVTDVCNALGLALPDLRGLNNQKKIRKIGSLSDDVKKTFELKFLKSLNLPDGEECSANYFEASVLKLKEKFHSCTDITKKIQILSLLTGFWSAEKIIEEFEVSEHLVKLTQNLVKKDGIVPDVAKRNSTGCKDEQTVQEVVNFFRSMDVSAECPGAKDCISVKSGSGQNVKTPERFLLANLHELYAQFKTDQPDKKVSFSKFCSLRPHWCVLPGAVGTHTVCVCSKHQNVKLAAAATRATRNYKDYLEAIVCDTVRESCMTVDNCKECPGKEGARRLLPEDFSDDLCAEVRYKQWRKDGKKQYTLVEIVESTGEFVESFLEMIVDLKCHHFVANEQSRFLKDVKHSLDTEDCSVLCDFAENYTFVVQDEIQSFHLNNDQATLFTVVIYYRENENIFHKSLVMISDTMSHDTITVPCFQEILVNFIKEQLPLAREIINFTDGAGGQFKNRKNFANLVLHKNIYGIDAEWHFHATSHGKSPCAGLGGTCKRLAKKSSLQRKESNHILTPHNLFQFCQGNIPGIVFKFVKAEVVVEHERLVAARFENALGIPRTRDHHCFQPTNTDEGLLNIRNTSSSNVCTEVRVIKPSEKDNKRLEKRKRDRENKEEGTCSRI